MNRTDKGWMRKMVGISVPPTTGLKVRGKYGQYLVRNRIGKGGNGVVFAVDVIDGGELLSSKYECPLGVFSGLRSLDLIYLLKFE